MTLLTSLTPRQLGELGFRMASMTEAELHKAVDETPNGLRAIGLMVAVAAGYFDPDDDPEPPMAA